MASCRKIREESNLKESKNSLQRFPYTSANNKASLFKCKS